MNIFSDTLSGYTQNLVALHNLLMSCRPFFMPVLYRPACHICSHSFGFAYHDRRLKPCHHSYFPALNAGHAACGCCYHYGARHHFMGADRQKQAWNICEGLLKLLSGFFEVSVADLRSSRRGGNQVARIRQFGMYIAHTMFGLSMAEVAHAFSRERTTVKHACHLIEDMRENAGFDREVSAFEYLIRSIYPYSVYRQEFD